MKRTDGTTFFFAALAVFSVFIIASQVSLGLNNLAFAQSLQDDSNSGAWKGRFSEVWKSRDNSVHKGELVLDLKVNGTEVTGLAFSKGDEEEVEFDYLDMIPIDRGTWANERLELEWGDKTTLVAEVKDGKLVGTYRYYWASGNQYDDWEGSFELIKQAP